MDNTLWHFGDSFGCWGNPQQPEKSAKKGFSKYIAEYYNLHYKHHAVEGSSNDEITKNIISNIGKFKKNDTILINWSFFTRYCFTNIYGTVKNINHVLNNLEVSNGKYTVTPDNLDYKKFEFDSKEYYDYVLFQKSSFVIEESIVHWKQFINPILLYIQNDLKCNVISTFNDLVLEAAYIDKSQPSKYVASWEHIEDVSKIMILDNSLKEIIWDDKDTKYVRFLQDNDYYKDGEDVHYKFGVQESLSKEWIVRLETQFKLSEKYNKKSTI